MLVGIVVKNSKDRFLILKRKVGEKIDLSLISGELNEDEVALGVKNLLLSETGLDFSESLEQVPLMSGIDEDGEYLILSCEKDLEKEEFKTVSDVEFLWLTFDRVKKLFKEKRLNKDQFEVLEKAKYFYQKGAKANRQAMKISHLEERYQRKLERFSYEDYVERYTDKRIFLRLVRKMAIKPCGKESRLKGELIANQFNNHKSFKNFQELMNDEEFILSIAKTSINPAKCEIYFYDYVNPYLKARKDFRLNFLKAIYLNENVYTLEDINTIIEYCEMEKENQIILNDINFKRLIEKRLDEIDYRMKLDYHCSGEEKELRKFKIEANEIKILCENMKKGLTEILNSFTVGKKVEENDEPTTYYEFLCKQEFKTI